MKWIFRKCRAAMPLIAVLTVFLPCSLRAADLTVFAAASLKEALDDQIHRFESAGTLRIVASYAASSVLARQIENGAPADLFISADEEWMNYLAARQLLDTRSRVDLLGNRLVLIAPASSTIEVRIAPGFPLAALLGDNRLAIADPDHVPAGIYARAALEKLGVWPSVAKRLAPAENVRGALAFVSRGESPLGIVYRTDALAEKNVRVVAEFPPATHPPIVYPAALTASSRSSTAGVLLDFLKSDAARPVWERHGFAVVR